MTTKTTKTAVSDALTIANKSLEQSVNTGVLFMNDRRRDDRDPTMTGRFNFENQPAYMAAWIRKQGGKSFVSFSITHAVTREVLAQGRFERNLDCDVARNQPSSTGSVFKSGERVAVWRKSPEGKRAYLFVSIDMKSVIDNNASLEDF